jgi:hypothetical protein
MAFVAGQLLPHGSFRLDMSAIQPGSCRVIVVGTPHLPPRIAEMVERAAKPGAEPNPELWARAFACVMANVHGVAVPVFMELAVTGISWSPGNGKPDPAKAA